MASAEKVWGMPSPSATPPPIKRKKRLIRLRVFNVGKRRYVCIEKWQMNFCPLFFLERKRCDGFEFFPVGILEEPFVPLYVSNKRWRDYHLSYRIENKSPLQSEPLTMGRRRRQSRSSLGALSSEFPSSSFGSLFPSIYRTC